jgi:hypothetical protein
MGRFGFLALSILLSGTTAFALGQAVPVEAGSLLLSDSLNAPMTPNCSVIETPVPPFYVTKAATATLGTSDGTLPASTLVQIDTNNSDAANLANQALMSVQVLSVPGAPSRLVGSHVHISSHSLLPATTTILGTLGAPGSAVNADANKMIFVIRRDSQYYNIPELRGKAVRLAQDAPHIFPPMSANYFVKRCCSAPPAQSLGERWNSRYTPKPYEEKPNPGCTYQPVFEVLKDIGDSQSPHYVPEGTFAVSTNENGCRAFQSALTPAGSESYSWMQMGKPRNGQGGGNQSKGACRAAVRATLVRMGLLKADDHPPSDRANWHPASGFSPWLGTRPGWQNMTRQYSSLTAPVGCVIVYGGAGAGHIEIRTQANQYCSDYCTGHPRDGGGADRSRPMTGVFCPRSS